MPIKPDDFDFDPLPSDPGSTAFHLTAVWPARDRQAAYAPREAENRADPDRAIRPDRASRESSDRSRLDGDDFAVRRADRAHKPDGARDPQRKDASAPAPPSKESARQRNWRSLGILLAFLVLIGFLVLPNFYRYRTSESATATKAPPDISAGKQLEVNSVPNGPQPHADQSMPKAIPEQKRPVPLHAGVISASKPIPPPEDAIEPGTTMGTAKATVLPAETNSSSVSGDDSNRRGPTDQAPLDGKGSGGESAAGTVAPHVYRGPPSGDFVWSGAVEKGQLIEITNGNPTVGAVSGRPLPGVPVSISIENSRIAVVMQPNPLNHFSTVVFRSTSKGRIAFGVHWVVLPGE